MKAELINTLPKLKKLAKLMQNIDEFAFDTETNTVSWCNADNDNFKIVDITISWGEVNNYLIPMGHIADPTPQLDPKIVSKYLKPVFEREDVTIIGWNLKFDMHVLKRIGIEIKTPYIFDGMIASWICDENYPNGLKPNVLRFFNHQMETYDECVKKVPNEIKKKYGLKANQKATFDLTMIEGSVSYATEDSYYTFQLYLIFLDMLEDEGMDKIYYKLYPTFIKILFDMEEEGITLDTEECKRMDDEIKRDLEKLEYRLLELAGCHIDINSSQQLATLLFGYHNFKNVNEEALTYNFGFKVISTTAKGVPQTNNATIEKLAQQEFKRNKYKQEGVEFCKLLLEYKSLSKLKTFTNKFLEVVYPDGKIHCSFNPIGTDSGRISCSNPNLMQIPNGEEEDKYAIRRVFIGDNKDHHIISCD